MSDITVEQVEIKLAELVRRYKALEQQNQVLRNQEVTWQQERVGLLDRLEIARVRTESLIQRLKNNGAES